ncbi:hypothetical protein [Streptomyces thermolineatus]|uniref:SCO2584 family spore wall biosynthesis protein n=1 Tax=Streptomyces thermolineatus TaxID=44033 RepID=UPI003850E083
MPDDVGGTPPEDGSDHESRHHGEADDEFAAVVLDEDFVRSAPVHEPTAAERLLAAARARAQAERGRPAGRDGFGPPYEEHGREHDGEWDDFEDDSPDGYPPLRRRSRPGRWHRTVAWVLALVMGIGVVALTVLAVYRGASSGRQQPTPVPTGTSRFDPPASGLPVLPPVAEHTPPVHAPPVP